MILVMRGDCTLGITRMDEAGNITEQNGPKFTPNPEGGCVAICDVDPDTLEPKSEADIFGDWDAAGYLNKIVEKLKPSRAVNIPNFRQMIRRAKAEYDINLCDYCDNSGYACQGCIITQWEND